METMLINFATLLIWGVLGCLFSTIIFRIAYKFAIKERLGFGNAFLTMLIASVINLIASTVLQAVSVQDPSQMGEPGYLLATLTIAFVIQSIVIHQRHQIGVGKAFWVSLIMIPVGLLAAIVMGLIVAVVLFVLSAFFDFNFDFFDSVPAPSPTPTRD